MSIWRQVPTCLRSLLCLFRNEFPSGGSWRSLTKVSYLKCPPKTYPKYQCGKQLPWCAAVVTKALMKSVVALWFFADHLLQRADWGSLQLDLHTCFLNFPYFSSRATCGNTWQHVATSTAPGMSRANFDTWIYLIDPGCQVLVPVGVSFFLMTHLLLQSNPNLK